MLDAPSKLDFVFLEKSLISFVVDELVLHDTRDL